MADKSNPGQGSSGKGIFQTPCGIGVTGSSPITSGGNPKIFDYGNATNGFDAGNPGECGGGVIQGPGTANGTQQC